MCVKKKRKKKKKMHTIMLFLAIITLHIYICIMFDCLLLTRSHKSVRVFTGCCVVFCFCFVKSLFIGASLQWECIHEHFSGKVLHLYICIH